MKGILDLINAGLCVIPVYPQTKRPKVVEGWPERTVQDNNLNEFSEGESVGVVLGKASGNLVDIDLDSDIARQIGHYFLPPTGWVFGRKGAPRSHFIFRSLGEPGRGETFKNNGKMIVEYRADGQQTVFPPSIHESGEVIEFAELGDIGGAARVELLEAAGWITAVELMASQYVEDQRQETILALAGTLLNGGKTENEVLLFVKALCDVTADDEKSKRIDAVRSTSRRKANGEGFTQSRHLIELIGEQATNDLCRYLRINPQQSGGSWSAEDGCGVLCADDKNDTGLAKHFSEHVKDRLLFVEETALFHVYKDGIWETDSQELETARELDKFIERRIKWLRSNSEGVSHDLCAAQIKFLLRYRNRTNALNAIKQARSFLCVPLSKLDQGDSLVAVRNGVLNLRDGVLLPFSPEHFVTKRLEVAYDSKADCPAFKNLLSDSFESDESLIDYVQGILGYCLTGQTTRQEVYILHGSGANGKSTLINAITNVLGPYFGTLMSETIFEGMGAQHNCDLASMHGKRLAVVHEAESRFKLNASRIKQLTGGDTIKVKALYKNPLEMVPNFKIVILCNKRPDLDAYDSALKRRIKLIPFDYVVPHEKRDASLGEKLKAEASGILNFMIEGAVMHFRGGIREPQAVRVATDSYIADHDSVRSFLNDATSREPKATVGKGELYDAYCQYCNDECMTDITKREFGKILLKMGCQDTRGATERRWKGLRLCSEGGGLETPLSVLPIQVAG